MSRAARSIQRAKPRGAKAEPLRRPPIVGPDYLSVERVRERIERRESVRAVLLRVLSKTVRGWMKEDGR